MQLYAWANSGLLNEKKMNIMLSLINSSMFTDVPAKFIERVIL